MVFSLEIEKFEVLVKKKGFRESESLAVAGNKKPVARDSRGQGGVNDQ